ncbi:MAG: type I restriction endonuclease subunit S [Geobacter sp.]|nr:MAG: type I restriction endonuclease subunit S [Geobacter sp.]
MNYRPYPRYKDSGVEWLGEVPEGWEVDRLRFHITTNPAKSELNGFAGDDPVSFVPMEAVGEYGGLSLEQVKLLDDVGNGYTYFKDGDVVVAKITPCFENGKGAIAEGLENGVGFGTTELHVLRPSDGMNKRFLFYLTISDAFRKIGESYMYGAGGQKRVPEDFIRDLRHPTPSLSEQLNIATFLDRKTAEIDALIEKKQKLIELLQEQRIAIISHAVTKGLNPKARMKDSGVSWLGEVPEHWEVKPLKHLCDVRGGVTKGRNLEGLETLELPYLRVANVQDGHLDLTDVTTIEVPISEVERYSLKVGDILMNEGGDNDKLGRGALWTGEIEPCLHQNHVFAVRPKSIESEWIALITQSNYAKFYFYQQAKQTTNLASISSTNLKQLPVVLPPEHERQRILEHVDRATFLLDRILDGITAGAEKLKEYRTALISAAVTGKIDVRSATA